MRNDDLYEDLLRPDQSDRATAMEELRRRAALSVRRPEGPEPIGECHNCGVAVERDARWCDKHCRDDWEKAERVHAMRDPI
jgi:hypothetical protein